MRSFKYLVFAVVYTFANWSSGFVSAQINYFGGPSINNFTYNSQIYQMHNGNGPNLEQSDDGFRLFGDFSLVRTGYPLQNNNSFHYSGELLSLSVYRPFEVGPFPVNADFSLSEDFKAVLANGADANPRFEITSRAYVLALNPFSGGPPQLIDELYLPGVDADDSRLTSTGFHKFDLQSEIEDFVLGPGLQYALVYDFSVYARHDALVDDPLSVFTLEFGGFSNYNGMEVALDGTKIAPEPSAMIMAALGVLPVVGVWWRRRKRGIAR